MPLTAPTAALDKVQRGLTSLAQLDGAGRTTLLKNVRDQVKGLLKNEFATATSPLGSTWEKTKRGRQALLSKKLPQAFESRIENGVVAFVAYTPREWLLAHQTGHTFAARKVAANKNVLHFNKKGRLVSKKAFKRALDRNLKSKKPQNWNYSRRWAGAHTIRARVLPARPSIPEGSSLPALWGAAVSAGITQGMAQWASGMQK